MGGSALVDCGPLHKIYINSELVVIKSSVGVLYVDFMGSAFHPSKTSFFLFSTLLLSQFKTVVLIVLFLLSHF